MIIDMNEHALQAVQIASVAVAWVFTARTFYQLLHLRNERRRQELFHTECIAAIAASKESGRTLKITSEEITQNTK